MSPRLIGLLALGPLVGCFSPSGGALDTDAGSSSGTTIGTASSGVTTETTTTNTGSTTDSTTDTTTGTSTTGPETTGGSSSGGVVLLECVEELLEPAIGSPVASANTVMTGSDFEGTCAGANTNDVAFQWIAPFSDYFVFDTEGSDFDTSMYLLDGACDGPELDCSDNVEGSVSSRVVRSLEEGTQVVVVVDGVAGEDGNAVLNVSAVDCPTADVSQQALPATFSNVAGSNQFSSACGGDGNLERTFRYTASAAGLYSFRATSSAFTPITFVQDGPECGGIDVQCNQSPGQVGSEVIRNLAAGQSVTVIVDSAGGTGNFELDVVELALQCPEGSIVGDSVAGDIASFEHSMTASCGPVGEASGPNVNFFNAATYLWTSPGMVGTSSGCDLIYEGGFPSALTLQEGGVCAGPELQCDSALIQGANNFYTASVSVGHIPPTEFTVTLTQTAANLVPLFGTDFVIRIECFAIA